jgi:N-acetyl-anhydromuramyl-L-alanine amidase AmpD
MKRSVKRWVTRGGGLALSALGLAGLSAGMATCRSAERVEVGRVIERHGDEIMVAGRLVRTGAPVVLWFDPGGYDAYRVERRFVPQEEAGWDVIKEAIGSPNRYSLRREGLDDATLERVRGGGWTLEDVQSTVDQFVLHYDVCGTSRQCFKILHDRRGLSVHFLLDIDGTIYQTLDVKERAWHATKANDRSVGVEIAHIGAYESVEGSPLEAWYAPDALGPRVNLPAWMGDGGVRTPGFVGRPATPTPARGTINGNSLVQHDFTPEQYDSLIKLTAALCAVLPELECDYPRGEDGLVLDRAMTDEEFSAFRGVLGHWHVQENKVDPGPAMDWDRVVDGARALLRRR